MRGTAHIHPDFPGPQSDSHDSAVVELPAADVAARWTFAPAKLPTANQLDVLGHRGLQESPLTVVGYGTQEGQRGPGGVSV